MVEFPSHKRVTAVTKVAKPPGRWSNFRVTNESQPHETAVAWARGYLKKHLVSKDGGIADMERQLKATLVDCVAYINRNYEVDALCRSFPERLKALIAAGGERLSH